MTALPASERPLVSVIMAAYNAELYVAAALESVLAQDWDPFEVVLVDDGSTDRTGEIVQAFSGVRYVRQENAGPSAARNAAVEHARGELVANCDADDLLPPTRLRLQAEFLLQHPDVGAVFGRQEWLNAPDWMARDAVYGDVDGIPLSSVMFRRAVLADLGGYDTTFTHGEDMDFLIRMRERGIRYEVLPEIVLYRRFHETSLTGGRPPSTPLLRSLRAKLERDRAAREEPTA
ncbi:MAG TPA: glycosyltransferase family A protein [Gaiellaceae bacterium]|nr:glycosyltransferase family A protein [Gaiellaceae bacterium]